jgi:ATP-dependent RNA helicase DeaD
MTNNEHATSANPATHSYSSDTTSFASIVSDPALVERLNALGIVKPTPVQAAAVPLALANRDLVVQAQTGSGKTLAFVLPILAQLQASSRTKTTTLALIITPTRELANQVKTVVESITPDVSPACLIGGASAHAQEQQLKKDARIVIGTPGRLQDFIDQRLVLLRTCKTFVLDEADEMLSMGFQEEVKAILKRLPPQRQGLLFSATMPPSVKSLAYTFLRNPENVVLEALAEDKPKIDHIAYRVDGGVTSKASALCTLLKQEKTESAIVFCNTKSDTTLVEAYLKRRGFNASKINSDLSQKERDAVLASLRSGELKFLIATDVAARGIDIKELELVVNYSLHDEPEVYVHRTGRTGRAGASGKAVSLIGPQDFGSFYQLKRRLNIEFTELKLPVEPEAN